MTARPWPLVSVENMPWVTVEQMIEVDRVMIEDLRIGLKQMMENAGRNLAMLILELYQPARATVLAGSGGNGGGGLVAARHLANHGVSVTVVVSRAAAEFAGAAADQLEILQRMGLDIVDIDPAPIAGSDVIVDALIGYSLTGAPRGAALDLIDAANQATGPVVSLDVPSGVDGTSGDAPGSAVRADATLTLAAPKAGLRNSDRIGRLFVADISVPPAVYSAFGHAMSADVFRETWLVEVDR